MNGHVDICRKQKSIRAHRKATKNMFSTLNLYVTLTSILLDTPYKKTLLLKTQDRYIGRQHRNVDRGWCARA